MKKKIKYIILFSIVLILNFNFVNSKNRFIEHSDVNIYKIEVDDTNKVILFYITNFCEQSNNEFKDKQSRFRLNVKNADVIYKDIVVKEVRENLNDTVLLVYPPLNDSSFRGEKREFIFDKLTNDSLITKKVILGSLIYPYDLRIYMESHKLKSITVAGLITFILVLLLISIKPLYTKYRFKKNHIKKHLNKNEKEVLDPFTFVPIKPRDSVVEVDNQLILLSSWKRLNKLPESTINPEYAFFFKEGLGSSFFDSTWRDIKNIHKTWLYYPIGIFLGWLVFVLFKEKVIGEFILFNFTFLDTATLQVSSSIATDIFMGTCIAISFNLSRVLGNYYKGSKKLKIFEKITSVFLIVLGFTIQSLISIYVIDNREIASFLSWFFLALFFVLSTNLKPNFKEILIFSVLMGFLCFGIVQFGKLDVMIKVIGIHTPIFISFILIGTLANLKGCFKNTFNNEIFKPLE